MNRKPLIAAAVALAAATAQASAQADKDRKADTAPAGGRTSAATALFERLDRNDDGFVTRDEARDATELQGRFAELDKDNDGKISRSEMRGLDSDRSAAGASKAKR